MRILQVITLCELGGAQSVVVNLANSLCKSYEVIVAAGEGDGKMFDLLAPSIKIERVPSLIRKLSPVDELKAIAGLRKIYNQYKPDIIHLHSSKAGILGRIAFPKRRTVYTVHGFDSIRLAFRKFLPIERVLQKQCSAIVGVSKYDESNLIAEGIKHNVSTVYNGIFKPEPLNCDPFEKYNVFKGTILSIARFSKQKNLDLFLEVARLLPQYAFIWIGNQDTPHFEFPKNVFFLGNIAGAGSYTAYADLFMLPSNYEGLPMVIIEALACGTPVVASNVGGITELLDGSNGFALENDAQIMANKIESILQAPVAVKEEMSKAAINTYLNGFTVEKMVEGYLKIYNKIIGNK